MGIDADSPHSVHAGTLVARRLRASGIDTLFTLSGGHIRNAVLHAAALDPAPQPIAAEHLLAALVEEYRKLGRTPPPQIVHARSRASGAVA